MLDEVCQPLEFFKQPYSFIATFPHHSKTNTITVHFGSMRKKPKMDKHKDSKYDGLLENNSKIVVFVSD